MKKNEGLGLSASVDPARRIRWPNICTKKRIRVAIVLTARSVKSVIDRHDEELTIITATDLIGRLSEMKGLIGDLELRKEPIKRLDKLKSIHEKLSARLRTLMEANQMDTSLIDRMSR